MLRNLKLLHVFVLTATTCATSSGLADDKKYGPGVTDAEIKIG